jgi:Rrf2 family protein
MRTTTEIAGAEGLSAGYVQQIMGTLQAAGLVVSHRGKQVGFKLARPPHLITVADAVRVIEGDIRLAPCYDAQNCQRIAICPTRAIWMEAASILKDYFEQTTIAGLVGQGECMAAGTRDRQPRRVQRAGQGQQKGVDTWSR